MNRDEERAAEREQPLGPNVKELIAVRTALLAIPPGAGADSFAMGLSVLRDRDRRVPILKEATAWVQQALAVLKTAPDYDGSDDEALAGELLRRIAGTYRKGSG